MTNRNHQRARSKESRLENGVAAKADESRLEGGARGHVLGEHAIALVAARFRALGDPSRIRLLNLLMGGEMSVQQLVEASGMSQTNVSRHLGLLRREGVVARRRDGKLAVYRIVDPHIETLCTLVCGGIESHLEGGLDALQGGGI